MQENIMLVKAIPEYSFKDMPISNMSFRNL